MNPSIGRITHQEGACMPDNRLVKIEVQVKHLTDAVQEVKADVREFRSEFRIDLNELRTDTCNQFNTLRKDSRSDFRLLFGAIIAVALSLSGLMAKGFNWV